jgi:glycolate oxidase FAD binding subunit
MSDLSQDLHAQVCAAASRKTPLTIVGSGSKRFYGRAGEGTELQVGGHCGIIYYEPTELVITARTGTPLTELEAALAERGQMLAFEPPHFGPTATLGGTVACGLSGPRRPYAGAVRDFVLGVRLLNGRGEPLRFGGEVMKNVAGYDVSRLMVGALGTLGVLLDISLKVLPQPAEEITLLQRTTPAEALTLMNAWMGQPWPLSAACFGDAGLYVRLSGTAAGVKAARAEIGGDTVSEGVDFWRQVREHTHVFFAGDVPLWRLAVPANTPPLPLAGRWWLDWGGMQRWLRTEESAAAIRSAAIEAGGHATLFRGGDRREEIFQPLDEPLAKLQRTLKTAFDPDGILNPGRMYRVW